MKMFFPGLEYENFCITSILIDYPVIQAYVLMVGVLFVVFNLIFDIIQYISDPRLRKGDELIKMLKRLLKNKMALMCIALILILIIEEFFAPLIVPNDPYENNI